MTMLKTIQFTYLIGAEYDHGEDSKLYLIGGDDDHDEDFIIYLIGADDDHGKDFILYLIGADDDHEFIAQPEGENVTMLLAPFVHLVKEVGQCCSHCQHVANLRM